jgi:hypothetical protein
MGIRALPAAAEIRQFFGEILPEARQGRKQAKAARRVLEAAD